MFVVAPLANEIEQRDARLVALLAASFTTNQEKEQEQEQEQEEIRYLAFIDISHFLPATFHSL